MAFTFDSTIGGANANSYCSVSQADDYFGGRLDSSNWDDQDNANKEAALVMATRRIDEEMFFGRRAAESQALSFPRHSIHDKDGYTYSQSEIPASLIYATCELALFYLSQDDRLVSEAELHDGTHLDSYKVGPLTYSFKGSAKANMLPERVASALQAIGPGIWIHKQNLTLLR